MTRVTYAITSDGHAPPFSFRLVLEAPDGLQQFMRTGNRWSIASPAGLGTLERELTPPGAWSYVQGRPDVAGFIFARLEGKDRGPFAIALHEVPDDYMHGPFCSTAVGKGVVSPRFGQDIPVQWKVAGPGCV